MSESTAAAQSSSAPAAAEAKTAKKSKPTAKLAKKAAATVILKPQARILKALLKAGKPLDRLGIAGKAKVDKNWVVEYLGGTKNPASDTVRGAKKLVPAGLVRRHDVDVDGVAEIVYELTSAGRKAASKIDG